MNSDTWDYPEGFEADVRIVVAKYYNTESEARLYAARLWEAGIPFFISNSHMGATLPVPGIRVGLHVREEDLPTAAQILARVEAEERAAAEPDYRDATLEDIHYLKKAQGASARNLWWYLLVVLTALLTLGLVVRSFLRANGMAETWRDWF